MTFTRKDFLRMAGLGVASGFLPVGSLPTLAAGTVAKPDVLKFGIASYTLHKFSLDDAIKMTKKVGLTNIALKSHHLALDSTPEQIDAVMAKVKAAGLNAYGVGVIYMKSEAEVNKTFEYAKQAGVKMIIGVPNHELLPLVNQKVKQTGITLAIHNHGPGDKVYPSPQSVYDKIKSLDKRIGLCIDIGHTQRIGLDPSVEAAKYADRLYDVHFKDVTGSTEKDKPLEAGRGVIDIPKFLKTLAKIKYSGIVALEYEKDMDDPIAGIAETVGYARGVVRAMV